MLFFSFSLTHTHTHTQRPLLHLSIGGRRPGPRLEAGERQKEGGRQSAKKKK